VGIWGPLTPVLRILAPCSSSLERHTLALLASASDFLEDDGATKHMCAVTRAVRLAVAAASAKRKNEGRKRSTGAAHAGVLVGHEISFGVGDSDAQLVFGSYGLEYSANLHLHLK
jgi:hypothetical protein